MSLVLPDSADPESKESAGLARPSVSVVIPVLNRFDDIVAVHHAYRRGLEEVAPGAAEFIYVLDGPWPQVAGHLEQLRRQGEPIRILQLPRAFGESSVLTVAFRQCTAPLILTLPSYLQVDPAFLGLLFEEIEGADMVVAARDRRGDSLINRARAIAFGGFMRVSGARFSDLGCGVRLMRLQVARSLSVYGEQHRFLPLLAEHHGFRVRQVTLPQHLNDRKPRWDSPLTLIERALDVFALFFLLRFTRKPFRFFGALGLLIGALGVSAGIAVSFEKLAYNVPLADRPSLILSVLLMVLGVQITAIGLVGEIVIFTRLRTNDDLLIEEIVQGDFVQGPGE